MFSPDGRYFFRSTGKELERWDMTTFQKVEPFPLGNGLRQLAFTPHGNWLVGLNSSRRLVVLDATTGKTLRAITLPRDSQPSSLAVAADGRHVIVGNVFGACYVFRLTEE